MPNKSTPTAFALCATAMTSDVVAKVFKALPHVQIPVLKELAPGTYA